MSIRTLHMNFQIDKPVYGIHTYLNLVLCKAWRLSLPLPHIQLMNIIKLISFRLGIYIKRNSIDEIETRTNESFPN